VVVEAPEKVVQGNGFTLRCPADKPVRESDMGIQTINASYQQPLWLYDIAWGWTNGPFIT
jgi:hypothetical protein